MFLLNKLDSESQGLNYFQGVEAAESVSEIAESESHNILIFFLIFGCVY